MIPAVKLDTVNQEHVYLTIPTMRLVLRLMTPITHASPTPATIPVSGQWSKTAPSRPGVQKQTECMIQKNVAINVILVADLHSSM